MNFYFFGFFSKNSYILLILQLFKHKFKHK